MTWKTPAAIGLCAAAITMAAGGAASGSEDEKQTVGAWEIEQSKSQVDDSLQATATNLAADLDTALFTSKPGALLIRCKDQQTDLFVATGGFLGLSIDGTGVKVIYRIDDKPAVTQQWSPSTEGKAAFYPGSPISFIRSLPNTGQLFIRVYDFQGSYGETAFSLEGIDEVRSLVGTACHWPAPKS